MKWLADPGLLIETKLLCLCSPTQAVPQGGHIPGIPAPWVILLPLPACTHPTSSPGSPASLARREELGSSAGLLCLSSVRRVQSTALGSKVPALSSRCGGLVMDYEVRRAERP